MQTEREYVLDKDIPILHNSAIPRRNIMAEYLFDEPRFHNPDVAREYLESVRWPKGPVCPHCGAVDRMSKLNGQAHRPGVYDCGHCRDQFTVTVGTVFERSKISLEKWLFAAALMASSKKGISSKQIERMIGVSYKTAWFMTHRLREAMKSPGGLMGHGGGTVEADETYTGRKPGSDKRRGHAHKEAVFSLVERNGKVRSFHVNDVTSATLKEKLVQNVSKGAHLMTDDAKYYVKVGREFANHESVNHREKEYVRGDAHTNTVEGFFSIFKRGIYGVYQHVSSQHLERYTTEFDFRYNHREKLGFNDASRTDELLKGIVGKRLTYRRINA
jgi:transposase-like protein